MQQGNDPNQVPIESVGSGWSQKGHDAYNDFYDMVVTDREQRGATFNMDLWRYYSEQKQKREMHRITKSKKKTKGPTRNDLKLTRKCVIQGFVAL
jgi:hypothetical protein